MLKVVLTNSTFRILCEKCDLDYIPQKSYLEHFSGLCLQHSFGVSSEEAKASGKEYGFFPSLH